MQPSFPRLSPYFCVNSLIIGPRICEEDRSISPFCLQYQPQEDGSATPTHIRFIIVRDISDPKLAELVVESWSSPWIEDDERRRLQPTVSYRDVLRYRRERNKRDGLAHAITLVFEAAYVNEYRLEFICFPEHARPRRSPPRVILLDHFFPLPPSLRHPWSSMFYIQSSIQTILYKGLSFDWDIESRYRFRADPKQAIPSVLHLTVVKPIATCPSRRCPTLPLNILHQIVFEIIKYRPPMWNLQLLYLGLISRSWASLLDMFFELHASPYSDEPGKTDLNPRIFDYIEARSRPPQILRVARSLMNGRPERALLMTKFSLEFYREGDMRIEDDNIKQAMLASVSRIIYHARSLKDLTINAELFLSHRWIFRTLWDLTLVDRCIVHPGLGKSEPVPIVQMQRLLARWPRLKVFQWMGKGSSAKKEVSQPRIGNESGADIELQCSLEELSILYDDIIGVDFHRFLNVPSPSLSKLLLHSVGGMTNEDLYASLSLVTGSLNDITIRDCTISKRPDEEYALDVLISQMTHLEEICVSTDVISCLTVARKIPGEIKAGLTVVGIQDASFLHGFGDAIRTSGSSWRSVYLVVHGTFPRKGFSTLSELKHIADECGAYFVSTVDPLTTTGYGMYDSLRLQSLAAARSDEESE